MTQPTMNSIDVEVIFLGDAPGQADTIKLGKTVYERGKTYRNVPLEHFRRGGFYAFEQWDGIPILLGKPVRRGIVLGTAPSMWDDLEAARGLLEGLPWDLITVNGAGLLYKDRITMWCSIHGNKLVKWINQRRDLGYDMAFVAYGNFSPEQNSADVVRWNHPNGGGSSSLFAVLTALELGYEQLILCGVRLEGIERFEHDAGGNLIKADCPYESYRSGWTKALGTIKDKVRSMGGWPAEILGVPTRDWLLAGSTERKDELSTVSGDGGCQLGNHTPGDVGPSPTAATKRKRKRD